MLNLGHAVGRVIESLSSYKLLHEETVGIRFVAAFKLFLKYGFVTDYDCKRVISLLKRAKLIVKISSCICKEDLVKKLYTDPKRKKYILYYHRVLVM